MMNKKELSIIIVSYNNKEVLVDCIKSVIAMNDIDNRLEIIVVEQSSTNEIYDYLKMNYPQIITIRADNKGFGAGNNRGAEIANGKYLLFLNPDTILIEPIGVFVIDKFEKNKQLGLFGVQLLNGEHNRTSSFDSLVPYGFISKIRYQFYSHNNFFNEKFFYIQGADIFIRKILFETVGGFDETIFMYSEEQDLCLRIRKTGYHIDYFPEKRIVHLQGACTPSNYSDIFAKQLASFKYVCDKNGLPFIKIIEKEKKYQKLKAMLYRFFGKTGSSSYMITKGKLKAICSIMKSV